jgi:hypothetical protein
MSMTAGQPPKPSYGFLVIAQEGIFFLVQFANSKKASTPFYRGTRGNALKEQFSF